MAFAFEKVVSQMIASNENGEKDHSGKMLPSLIKQAGMDCIEASIFQQFLIKDDVRQLLLNNECLDNKEYQISDGHMTEQEWEAKYNSLKTCVDDNNTLIAFYAGNFTASRNPA